jgi:chemotaxis protein histidine kinase CheA
MMRGFLDAHWRVPGDLIAAAHALHEPSGADPDVLASLADRLGRLARDAGAADLGNVAELASALAELSRGLGSGALDPLGAAGGVLESGARALEDALVMLEAGSQPDADELGLQARKVSHAAGTSRPGTDAHEAPVPDPTPESWGPWSSPYPDMEGEFVEEIQSHIDNLQAGLIKLSSGQADAELVNDLFRSSHSIKGQSGQMGARPLEKVAHKLEDVLDLVRQGELEITPARTELLLGAIDALQSMLEQLRSTRHVVHDIEREIAVMQKVAAGEQISPSTGSASTGSPSTGSGERVEEPAVPAPPPAPRKEAEPPGAERTSAQKKAQYLRVDFSKVDQVMNLVGDLFINKIKLHDGVDTLDNVQLQVIRLQHLLAQKRDDRGERVSLEAEEAARLMAGIAQLSEDLEGLADRLSAATGETDMISSDLRDQVMVMRMVPMDSILGRLGRVVFDAVQKENRDRPGHKQARLVVEGSDAEIDKVIANMLEVPLVHIVRNAVAHGIESAEDRVRSGKDAEGRVLIRAGQKGGNFVIEVIDDGRGIVPEMVARAGLERGVVTEEEIESMSEKEILSLIFRPGFTTARSADDLKGRGVGLDEVASKVGAVKGSIEVASEAGRGTTVTLLLPLTLAINTVLVSEVAGETMAIPMAAVDRVVRVGESEVEHMGQAEVFTLLGETVTLVRADEMLGLDRPSAKRPDDSYVAVLVVGERRFGLAMDRMKGKQDVVVKSLGTLLGEVPLVAGATLLGEKCILILDPVDIAARIGKPARAPRTTARAADRIKPRLLLVDDETTARIGLRRIFEEAGLEVVEAADGAEALELAAQSSFQIVSTDVVMPRLDGYELTRLLRQMPAYRDVPIIMISSKSDEVDRRAGFDAGVDHYVAKPVERSVLLELIDEVRL